LNTFKNATAGQHNLSIGQLVAMEIYNSTAWTHSISHTISGMLEDQCANILVNGCTYLSLQGNKKWTGMF